MIISDQALWPKLQGKLNRELRVYKGTWPFWQSAGGLPVPCRWDRLTISCRAVRAVLASL
jgi:hypothetical protein